MKCCLNSRLPKNFLLKADEIKFQYRDRNSIIDYLQYKKPIILDCFQVEKIDWKQIESFKVLTQDKIILCLGDLENIKEANNRKISWYWGYPIASFYDLKAFETLGSCYLKIAAPLFFDLPKVKEVISTPLRHVPNVAFSDGLPHGDGISGTWIRPEDLNLYDPYIETIEFEDCDEEKEQTLYRVYMEHKEWSTHLNVLITNLNSEGLNRMFPSRITEKRLECKQRCECGESCRICYRYFYLANSGLIEGYIDSQTIQLAT